MEEYKANSHRSKREEANKNEKKVEKVVKGKAIKKKNVKRKLTDIFVSEDVSNVKNYVIMDVLVPAVKKAISDIVTNGIDMILYGETGRSKKSSSGNISYRDYYSKKDEDRRYGTSRRYGYSYDDIILDTRAEAEDVLRAMDGILDTYGVISVADYYDLVGVDCNYTDNRYGWMNIRNASIESVRDGYIIKMPKVSPID